MRVMNYNWSATKEHLHPQSVVKISRHSVLSGGQDSTMWNIVLLIYIILQFWWSCIICCSVVWLYHTRTGTGRCTFI